MKYEESTPREKLVTAGANHLLPISYQKECESWHDSQNKFQLFRGRHPRCPGIDLLSCPLPCLYGLLKRPTIKPAELNSLSHLDMHGFSLGEAPTCQTLLH